MARPRPRLYAITPRFAGTSTPEQLELAGALWREHPGTFMQTHIAENHDEIALVKKLFPQRRDYLDVYAHYGLTGRRAVLAHGVHLDESEFARCHATGTALAHCPTSNLFLGSGLFPLRAARDPRRPVQVGLGTDIGGGTSFSLLATMGEAYKVAQLEGRPIDAIEAFFLARWAARARSRSTTASARLRRAAKPTWSCSIRTRRRCWRFATAARARSQRRWRC